MKENVGEKLKERTGERSEYQEKFEHLPFLRNPLPFLNPKGSHLKESQKSLCAQGMQIQERD